MLSKAYPRLRTALRQFLGSVSSLLSRALKTTETISQNPRHVLKLLLNSRLAPPTQLQPDVYPFAAYLAERFGCTHVIAIGKPSPKANTNLSKVRIHRHRPRPGPGIIPQPIRIRVHGWTKNNSLAGTLPVPKEVVQRAVVVSKDVEQFADPAIFIKELEGLARTRASLHFDKY